MAKAKSSVDPNLWAQFAEYYPEIENGYFSEWELVNQIRKWASSFLRWAARDYLLDDQKVNNNTSISEMMNYFKDDIGGVWCSGAAIFLKRCYNAFGFSSACINNGIISDDGSMSHVITLVEIETPSGKAIVPQDAYLNCCIIGREEKILDYLQIVYLLATGHHELLLTKEEPVNRYVLYSTTEFEARKNIYDLTFINRLAHGAEKYRVVFSGSHFVRGVWRNAAGQYAVRKIIEDGYVPNEYSLLLYPLDVVGDWNNAGYLRDINALIEPNKPAKKRYWASTRFDEKKLKKISTASTSLIDWIPSRHAAELNENLQDQEHSSSNKDISADCLSPDEVERDVFLSIVECFTGKEFMMVELGGEKCAWCQATASIVMDKLLSNCPSTYYCLAVLAMPARYQLTQKYFEEQNLSGQVVLATMTNIDSNPRLNVENSCEFCSLPIAENTMVPACRLDTLINRYHLEHISLLQADAQVAELNMLKGALNSIIENKIEFMIIRTHLSNKLANNDKIKSLKTLMDNYDLLIDIYPQSGINDIWYADGPRKVYFPAEGLQVFRQKQKY